MQPTVEGRLQGTARKLLISLHPKQLYDIVNYLTIPLNVPKRIFYRWTMPQRET